MVGSAEHTNELAFDVKRNRYLRTRGFFATNVVRVFANIWRISHLTRGRDVANHAFLADLQTVAGAVRGTTVATACAGQHERTAIDIVQINVGVDTAKGTSDVIHNLVDEFVEVENRRDSLRSFLQL